MAAKFFGQFLLEKGLINKDQLLKALEVQRTSNPTLGEIAQAMGLLTSAQADRINAQQRRDNRRFGDIAQDLGLLTAADVDELLSRQKARRKLFGEILVQTGALTRDALEAELALHQRDREQAVQALELGIAGHPLGDVATAAINSCTQLFPRIVKAPCQYSSLATDAAVLGSYTVGARIRIAGERPFALAIACERELMRCVAASFLDLEPDDLDEALAEDAMGEYLNVLMGYVVKDVLPEDADYRAAPPEFARPGSGFSSATKSMLVINMTSQIGPFALIIDG